MIAVRGLTTESIGAPSTGMSNWNASIDHASRRPQGCACAATAPPRCRRTCRRVARAWRGRARSPCSPDQPTRRASRRPAHRSAARHDRSSPRIRSARSVSSRSLALPRSTTELRLPVVERARERQRDETRLTRRMPRAAASISLSAPARRASRPRPAGPDSYTRPSAPNTRNRSNERREPPVVRHGEHRALEAREGVLAAPRPRRGRGCRSARRAAAASRPRARAAGSGTAPAGRPTGVSNVCSAWRTSP